MTVAPAPSTPRPKRGGTVVSMRVTTPGGDPGRDAGQESAELKMEMSGEDRPDVGPAHHGAEDLDVVQRDLFDVRQRRKAHRRVVKDQNGSVRCRGGQRVPSPASWPSVMTPCVSPGIRLSSVMILSPCT